MSMRLSNAAASACAGDGSSAGLRAYIGTSNNYPVIKFYVGAVNTTPETAPAGTLLATLTATAQFGAASNGAIADTSWTSAAAAASGTAGSWMLFKSDGTTPVADGSVAKTSGGDVNFDENVFVSGGTVALSSLTLTVPPH